MIVQMKASQLVDNRKKTCWYILETAANICQARLIDRSSWLRCARRVKTEPIWSSRCISQRLLSMIRDRQVQDLDNHITIWTKHMPRTWSNQRPKARVRRGKFRIVVLDILFPKAMYPDGTLGLVPTIEPCESNSLTFSGSEVYGSCQRTVVKPQLI